MAATEHDDDPVWVVLWCVSMASHSVAMSQAYRVSLQETFRLCEALIALAQQDPTSAPVKPFAALSAAGMLAEVTVIRYPMLAVPLAEGFVRCARVLAPSHVELEDVPAAPVAAMKEQQP